CGGTRPPCGARRAHRSARGRVPPSAGRAGRSSAPPGRRRQPSPVARSGSRIQGCLASAGWKAGTRSPAGTTVDGSSSSPRPAGDSEIPCVPRAPERFMGAMQASELRERMAAAGIELPPELIDVVATAAGLMITSLDALLSLDLGDLEPFSPARRLPDDAG